MKHSPCKHLLGSAIAVVSQATFNRLRWAWLESNEILKQSESDLFLFSWSDYCCHTATVGSYCV